ncbi:MAG: hypothetical protein ABIY51_10070 [Ferruginibacter sp.]
MSKSIKIFKSFEEQEQYHLELMAKLTPQERFKALYQMQQLTKKFHPVTDKFRKIIIHHGRTKS